MADIPAVCNKCGAFFRSGIGLAAGARVTAIGNTSGPCPRCGSMGHVPDGVYTFIDNALHVIGPERSMRDLHRFAEVVEAAQRRGGSPEQIRHDLDREAPELQPLWRLLPRTPGDIIAFLNLIVAILTLFVTCHGSPEAHHITPQRVIESIFTST